MGILKALQDDHARMPERIPKAIRDDGEFGLYRGQQLRRCGGCAAMMCHF